jgi:branched-chain amino acid transport system ATP-binding protein
MSLLAVENLAASYGLVDVLKGVSLKVEKGEVVTILGANGAGKTTLLRSLIGLVRSTRGRVVFEGADVTRLPTQAMIGAGIGLVPEGRQLFPDHSVRENLELGAFKRLRAGDRTGVREDMEQVFVLFPRVKERLEQKAGLLSGGEQQMVAIGRALLGRPRLLMLDEPSLGLAPAIVPSIFTAFVELKRRGVSLLIVEQLAWLGLGVCDRAYVLEGGRFSIEGTREELKRDSRVLEAYLGKAAPQAHRV